MPKIAEVPKEVELVCLQCGKHWFVKYGLRHRKFCSNSCRGKHQSNISNNLKKAREANIKKRKGKTFEEYYGKEKALKLKKNLSESKLGDKNPSKRKEVKNKISNTFKEKRQSGWVSPLKGKKHTEEQNRNTSITTKAAMNRKDVKEKMEKVYKENSKKMKKWHRENKDEVIKRFNNPKTKEKMRVSHALAMGRGSGKYKNKKDTDIEIFVENILIQNGWEEGRDYFKQFPFPPEKPKYILDFYLPAYKLNIEAMGCYWHKCPECGHGNGREQDRRRTKFINNHGLNVYNIWGHQMKSYSILDLRYFLKENLILEI